VSAVDRRALSEQIRELCSRGSATDVEKVIALLNDTCDLPTTKTIDYYLGQIGTPEGIARVRHFLFHGTQMQRNYCTLFFARRNDWDLVNEAYRKGLIDRAQAYSR
jgi:hypothetical protein